MTTSLNMKNALENKWVRRILPALLVFVWLAIAGLGGPTFGKLSSVSSNDQSTFLPASAESTKVREIQEKFRENDTVPAIIVIETKEPIQPSEYRSYGTLISALKADENIGTDAAVAGPIPSDDGKALQFIVPIQSDKEIKEVVESIRGIVKDTTPDGQTAYVAGPAGLTADLTKAFAGIDGILLVVALSVVFVILLLVYRSIILPFIVLLNSVIALCGAILIVFFMAKAGWITLNGQSQGILSILVIGAATDYSLLLVARYREALQKFSSKWQAMYEGYRASFEPILASGITVIAALLCLLFSDLNSNKSLGPIAATGIVFSLLTTFTFLPAVLALLGRSAFWPSRPKVQKQIKETASTYKKDLSPLWRTIGIWVERRPRALWVTTVFVLLIGSAGILQLRANGVSQTDFILAESEAVEGQKILADKYDSAFATPMVIIAPADKQTEVVSTLETIEGVASASTYSSDTQRPGQSNEPAKVVDGKVLINAVLTESNSDSDKAEATIVEARKALAKVGNDILVGGITAIALDTNVTAQNDLKKIIPIVLSVIFVILIILLRSVVAPLLLILTVIVSYTATLGVSALLFNSVFEFPGADASVPLFGFVFLVALGIDYNIFLMTRIREESKRIGTRKGIVHGLGKTGGVITSAGVVLAATFAALGIIPILFLAQLAFIVAFGVLIDTIVVRSLLVPALGYDIGKKIWWPSILWKKGGQ